MNTYRKTAIIVGVLYIIGTVAGILCKVLTGSIQNDLNLLTKVTANENQIIIGALFLLIMGLALAMVPVMMFPILKKHNEALALGYVVYRGALETVTTIAMVIGWLFLTVLSQQYIAGAPDASYFQTLGTLLLNGNDSISTISQIVFPSGCSDILLFIVSIKTHSPMDIRLGSHCRHIVDSRDLVRFVRYHQCLVDSPGRFSSSDRPARNGYGGMADR